MRVLRKYPTIETPEVRSPLPAAGQPQVSKPASIPRVPSTFESVGRGIDAGMGRQVTTGRMAPVGRTSTNPSISTSGGRVLPYGQLRTLPTITESQRAVVRPNDLGVWDSSMGRTGVDRSHDRRGGIRLRWDMFGSRLDERGQRLFAAVEVRSAGRGGLALVSKITGLARSRINRGNQDLDAQPLPKGQVRRAGGGRRAVSETDPGLVPALKRLIEPVTFGRSHAALDLGVEKHGEAGGGADRDGTSDQCRDGARTELVKLGFSRQSNRKADEGSNHPDRNAQFEYINAKVVAAQAQQQPVISVDTKKKELIDRADLTGLTRAASARMAPSGSIRCRTIIIPIARRRV